LEKESNDSATLRQELNALNQQMETRKNELMQMVAEEARHRNTLHTAEANKDNLRRRLRRLDEEAMLAAQKKNQLEQQAAASREELDQVKEEIQAYAELIAKQQSRLDEKSRLLAAQVKVAQSIEFDLNKKRSKLSALKKLADNYDWYRDGVKAIMRAHRAGTKEGKAAEKKSADALPFQEDTPFSAEILAIAADIFEAQPDYQIAVDAVLGEALQYIVVRNQADGLNAIDFLENRRAGRSGFIPLENVAADACAVSAAIPPKKRLLNHVKVKPGFEAVANCLLGQVCVVADLAEALKISASKGPTPMVATLAGEIITPQGIMVGGSQDKLSGILAKKHELKATEQKVSALDQELAKAKAHQAELEQALGAIEVELADTKARKKEMIQAETESEKEHYRLTEDLKHAKRHLEVMQLEQEQLQGEEEDLLAEVENQNKLLTTITAKVAAAQAAIADTGQNITRVTEDLEKFNQYTVDLKLRQTTLQSDLANSRSTLTRLKEFESDGIQRFEQLAREVVQKREKLELLKQKSVANQSGLGGVYEEIETLEKALAANESAFNALDAILKENDVKIASIQKEREATGKKIRTVELELSEKRVKRENIENRCDERYHMSIAALRQSITASASEEEKSPMTVSHMEAELARSKARLAAIGDVHMGAIEE